MSQRVRHEETSFDHVPISIQADEPTLSDRVAGTASFERKIAAARHLKELGWPLTLNVVLHDRVADVPGRARDRDRERHRQRRVLGHRQDRRHRAGREHRGGLARADVAPPCAGGAPGGFAYTGRLERRHGYTLLGLHAAYWEVSLLAFGTLPVEL
jgi:hypothetical protein